MYYSLDSKQNIFLNIITCLYVELLVFKVNEQLLHYNGFLPRLCLSCLNSLPSKQKHNYFSFRNDIRFTKIELIDYSDIERAPNTLPIKMVKGECIKWRRNLLNTRGV